MQIYLPSELGVADVVPRMAKKGIVITGGIHKDYKGQLSDKVRGYHR